MASRDGVRRDYNSGSHGISEAETSLEIEKGESESRSMALIGVEGFSALPAHCLQLCYAMFAAVVLINLARDLLPRRISQYIPIPMAMAIPFFIGGYFAIDMFIGFIIRFVYEKIDKAKSDVMSPAIAAGLICGDGVWTIFSAVLALSKIDPPLCMFFYAADNPLAAVGY